MRLDEPLYRVTFTTPESWSVEVEGDAGTEGRSFLIAEGRLSARYRGATFPRRRVDGALTPDFRGVLETDDGATVLFAWQGLARLTEGGMRGLVGSMTHVTEDERYRAERPRVRRRGGGSSPRRRTRLRRRLRRVRAPLGTDPVRGGCLSLVR